MKNELENLQPEVRSAVCSVMPIYQPPMTSEEIKKELDLNDRGMARNNITNAEYILTYDPLLRDGIKYNEITDKIDIIKDLGWNRNRIGMSMEEYDLSCIHLHCEKEYGFSSRTLIEEAVQIVAYRNSYNPFIDYVESLVWDGKERLRYMLHHFLGADTSDYNYEIMKLLMLGITSRGYTPGIKFDYFVTLVGDQGVGKSSFLRLLAIRDEWFTDDLKDLESNRVHEKLVGHVVVEVSEMLATTNAKSNESVKSFLSRQKDVYRTPYERYPKDRPRRCVFVGTTNKLNFLPNDRTGNRRYLPILCDGKQAEVFILDDEKASREYIDQVWAELMHIFKQGNVVLKLPKEIAAQVKEKHRQFMQEDVDAGLILAYMQDYQGDKVCSKQLYREALHNDNNPQRWQTNEINEIMNQYIRDGILPEWEYFDSPQRFSPEYGTQKGWKRVKNVNEDVSTEDDFPPRLLEEDDGF